jgi:hypothetical protein
MRAVFPRWSLILLSFSLGVAVGAGLYEHTVLTPLWRPSPPASFAIIQPGTGVPLQNFWVPVHAAITVLLPLSIFLTWRDRRTRTLLLVALGSYILMRAWSGAYFIPEMLAFQQIPPGSAPSVELSARVASWTFWSKFREPFDVTSFLCSLLALHGWKRPRIRVNVSTLVDESELGIAARLPSTVCTDL